MCCQSIALCSVAALAAEVNPRAPPASAHGHYGPSSEWLSRKDGGHTEEEWAERAGQRGEAARRRRSRSRRARPSVAPPSPAGREGCSASVERSTERIRSPAQNSWQSRVVEVRTSRL